MLAAPVFANALKVDQINDCSNQICPQPDWIPAHRRCSHRTVQLVVGAQNEGQFILRIDDTDSKRNVEQTLKPILDGFRWLGIDWDEGPTLDGTDSTGPYAPVLPVATTGAHTRPQRKLSWTKDWPTKTTALPKSARLKSSGGTGKTGLPVQSQVDGRKRKGRKTLRSRGACVGSAAENAATGPMRIS